MSERKRILLFSEGVTASQIVRLVTLGRSLDRDRFEVSFACSEFAESIFAGTGFVRRKVHSLDPKQVLRAVRQGRRLYDERLLRQQVAEDLEVFREVRPDLVVGDFRWSLAVSAPVHGVPHAALVNAYWSPFREHASFPVPDHPIVGVLGETLTARYFPKALPRVFSWFAAPLNALRRAHGLPELGSLPEVLTHGDYTLYADPEELVPTRNAPETHIHLGFVPWAPSAPLPPELDQAPKGRPLVYATLGSSGNVELLPRLVEALGRLPVTGLVATAGRRTLRRVPPNVVLTDYAPGDLAARRAAVVVSNGGSSTTYQALAEGTPVLGLPSNLDQFLAMDAVERHSAGLLQRARSATVDSIESALTRLLDSTAHRDGAARVGAMIARASAPVRFANFVERASSRPNAGTRRAVSASVPRGKGPRAAVLGLGGALSLATTSAEIAHAESLGEIHFTSKVPGTGGQVICALFQERGWLETPLQNVKTALRGSEATCVFQRIRPGTYAIVAFHDANGNGDIDKNFLGLPTESWCASRDAPAIFGPPSFGAAKFRSGTGVVRLGCTM